MSNPETSVKNALIELRPDPAALIAASIWEDCMDRRDIGSMLRSCDDEVQGDIRAAWEEIVRLVLKQSL